jgi:F-type H+-transporting ATPase subunit epsilon
MADAKSLAGQGGASLAVNMVTPRGPVAITETDAVTAPGALGEFEVLPGHVPFLTALHPGVLVLGDKERTVYAVGAGFLQVDQAGTTEILVQQAIAGSEVDPEPTRTELAAAEAELETWKDKPQDGDWKNLDGRRAWAQAQLDAHARARAS